MGIRVFVVTLLLLTAGGCSPPGGVFHKVEKGQTLYRISRVYGVDEAELAALNGIEDPTRMPVGARVFIPGADRVRPVPATALEKEDATPPRPTRRTALREPRKPREPEKQPGRAESPPDPRPPSAPPEPDPPELASRGAFSWPLRGDILKSFGSGGKSTGKGLEIAASHKTPVQSAAAGKVIYSGNGIRGYGNLVILKHQGGFFTVYGFNERNLVEAGAFVGRGEKIALSGTPPGGGKPRLYFEIRRGKKAVDPIFYLP